MKSYFIYDCIKNGILLEIIRNIIPNLYCEIMLLSMTGSRMELETIKNIISNLYHEIIFLSMTGSRMRFY